ncbi:MAG TPA: glycosyltransferase family 2 protein, partial [Solirubrobacteraceae bacterium]|nr:glycosyltransferase family 2 protein [Solirubrobacteraceae bacterium]
MTPSGPPVAVAVVSWNLRERLDACLRSLRPDHEAGRAEVWVVDNASQDGSAQLVRNEHPWARLIALADNRGYGPAVNLVARRTHTPWVAPANADLRLEPGALETLLRAGDAHPRAGVLAPRLLLADGRTQHSVHPFPAVGTTLTVNLGVGYRLARLGERLCLEGRWDPERERDVPWAHGALLLVRRAAWERVGGFDDAMWFYAEDLDLCWRLHRAGWATRYVPAARVHHDHSAAALAAWGEERLVRSQAAAYAWMRRRRGAARTVAVAALNAGVPALR